MRLLLLVLAFILISAVSGCVSSMEFSVRIENDGHEPAGYAITIVEQNSGALLYQTNLSIDSGQTEVLKPDLETDDDYMEVHIASSRGTVATWELDAGAACGSCILWVNDNGTRISFSQDVLD